MQAAYDRIRPIVNFDAGLSVLDALLFGVRGITPRIK